MYFIVLSAQQKRGTLSIRYEKYIYFRYWKKFVKAKKFTSNFWWRMYNNMGNSLKFNYIRICVINCGISGHSSKDSCW